MSPRISEQQKLDLAYSKWNSHIEKTIHLQRYNIPGRNDPDDLRSEALIQLLLVMRQHPDWDAVSSIDFQKIYKTALNHRLVDLVREQTYQCRDYKKDVSLEMLLEDMASESDASWEVISDWEDVRVKHENPEMMIIGYDLYAKVMNELNDDQREVLALLLHPSNEYRQYCESRVNNDDDSTVRTFLHMDRKEMGYCMNGIRQITSNIQSDYLLESLHSVMHMLVLPPEMAKVPHWCVWECLDTLGRRLLSLLVYSDLKTTATLGQLGRILGQDKITVANEIAEIKRVIKQLHQEGVSIDPPTQLSIKCCGPLCTERAQYTCFVTEVRGCDKHLERCSYNPNHRFVPSMRETHEHWCKDHLSIHSRSSCQYPGCSSHFTARCIETGMRGCEYHLSTCRRNPQHRFFLEQRGKHNQWCKAPSK